MTIRKMLSFVGRGMCTSVSADQRSEALGAFAASSVSDSVSGCLAKSKVSSVARAQIALSVRELLAL